MFRGINPLSMMLMIPLVVIGLVLSSLGLAKPHYVDPALILPQFRKAGMETVILTVRSSATPSV